MKVELLVVPDCPNEGLAARLLRSSLVEVGLADTRVDVVVLDSDEAAQARGFSGSPSFCVDGGDLFPEGPTGLACRVYPSPDGGLQGLLSPGVLIDRLRRATRPGDPA